MPTEWYIASELAVLLLVYLHCVRAPVARRDAGVPEETIVSSPFHTWLEHLPSVAVNGELSENLAKSLFVDGTRDSIEQCVKYV